MGWYNPTLSIFFMTRRVRMLKGSTVAKVAFELQCHPNTLKRIEKRLNIKVKRDYKNYRIYSDDVVMRIKEYLNSER
jgi:hypothetical protein